MRVRILCSLLVILCAATNAHGDDWPSFRNGLEQHGVASTELPENLELLWERDAGDGITTTAAIVDGRVYVGTLAGEFWCLDLTTGDEIWTAKSKSDDDFLPAFYSPPTVTDDFVYVGDEYGEFYAFARDDGSLQWSRTTGDQVVGGATIVSLNVRLRLLVGSHDGSLLCLNADDGSEVWTFMTDGPVNCSAAVASDGDALRTFVAGCDELLRVIDVATAKQVGSMPLGSPLIASPAIKGDTLYVGSYAGEFSAIDWKSLTKRWSVSDLQDGNPIHSSAAVTDELVVVGGRDKHVRAFDRETGEQVWEVATRSKIDSSPVVVGGRVFIGTNDKRLLEIDLKTGDIRWQYAAGRPISASPAIADGHLVIGTEGSRGRLLCFGTR